MRPGGFPHLYTEVLSGKALCARYSHELPDHVPGDELDGLWLVVQAQGSEIFPNGMLISEQHNGAVALGQRLWCQEGQLKSWSPHFLLVSPNFKCSLPLSWGPHPAAEEAGWGLDCRTTKSSQGTESSRVLCP